jgi:hypothetical protein
LPGLTETTLTGPAFFLWVATVLDLAADTVGCEGPVTATTISETTITAAAPAAVTILNDGRPSGNTRAPSRRST